MSKETVISVGHGKNQAGIYDPGAVSRDKKYHEFRIAREIAKYAAEYLQCDLINYDGGRNLPERIKDVNRGNYGFAAEIHLNAGGGTGTETFYFHGSPTGKRAAKEICENVSAALGVRNRGAKVRLNSRGEDYFGFIRQTKPCAVLEEAVFIDCDSDLGKVKTEAGMKACGEAIAKGIENALADNTTYEVTAKTAFVRSGAGENHPVKHKLKLGETFTVTVTAKGGKWGKLADGRGWISLEKGVKRVRA